MTTRTTNDITDLTTLTTSGSSGITTSLNTSVISTTTNGTSRRSTIATTDRSTSSTESRKKPEYEIGTIIDQKWKVLSELGRGGCGIVYCVERIDAAATSMAHPKAALKAEYVLKHYSETLAAEANILRKLNWSRHVCQLYACGRITNDINIVCMSLAGPSLSYLRRHSPQQRMTFSTALRIAYQCLNAIEDLHCIGYLHRDVKASNFALGYYTSEARTVRILDFGFARSYLSWDSTRTYLEPRKPRPRAPFLGTDRYCSLNVHHRTEQGRRDDCWSWLFMLVELLYGKLPWRDVKPKKIAAIKEASLPKLFQHGPIELYAALDHLQALQYESRPNYELLRDIITKICIDRGFRFSDPYDWEAGGEYYESFEKLKNLSSYTTTTTSGRTATSDSPLESSSKKLEFLHKPSPQMEEESFVEILERQPSPPAEKFTSLSLLTDNDDKNPLKNGEKNLLKNDVKKPLLPPLLQDQVDENNEKFEDAKDGITKKN